MSLSVLASQPLKAARIENKLLREHIADLQKHISDLQESVKAKRTPRKENDQLRKKLHETEEELKKVKAAAEVKKEIENKQPSVEYMEHTDTTKQESNIYLTI